MMRQLDAETLLFISLGCAFVSHGSSSPMCLTLSFAHLVSLNQVDAVAAEENGPLIAAHSTRKRRSEDALFIGQRAAQ